MTFRFAELAEIFLFGVAFGAAIMRVLWAKVERGDWWKLERH